MKIKILHLFYDFLNLYGESANTLAFVDYFKKQGIECELIKHSLGEDFNLDDIDIVYIGSGENKKIIQAFKSISDKKLVFENFIKSKHLLITGNAIRIFSKEMLNICDTEVKLLDRHKVYESIITHLEIKEDMIAFYNNDCELNTNEKPLFKHLFSKNKDANLKCESFYKNNLFATLSIGPFYIRNYCFLKYVCDRVILSKESDFVIKEVDFNFEKNALKTFISNYYPNYK